MDYPRAGAHYPRSTGEFLAWFRTDEDCLDYLEWLRWPGGFACPHCGHAGGWRLADGRIECGGCSRRTSVTAGTIFDKTRTPLTVWFHACWLFATAKDGISAQYLQRSLGDRLLPDGVGDAAPAAVGAGAAGPGPAGRDGGGGRDVHRRGGARPARRAAARQEGADRHRGRDQRAEGHRPVPDGRAGRRVRRLAGPVRGRQRRAGRPA